MDQTSLIWAVLDHRTQMVGRLLADGANPNAVDRTKSLIGASSLTSKRPVPATFLGRVR
jgi:hypothetical protein